MYRVVGDKWEIEDSDEFVSEHFDTRCSISRGSERTSPGNPRPSRYASRKPTALQEPETYRVKNYLDMSLTELGAVVNSCVPDEPEYTFDVGYLAYKANCTHEILNDDLDNYFGRTKKLRLLVSGIDGHPNIYPSDGFKAAGCLFYWRSELGELYFLLEKRVDSPYHCDLGGRKEGGENVYQCASREVYEESNGLLSLEGATYLGIFEDYGFFVKHIPPVNYDFGREDYTGVKREISWVNSNDPRIKFSARIPRHILF